MMVKLTLSTITSILNILAKIKTGVNVLIYLVIKNQPKRCFYSRRNELFVKLLHYSY